MRQRKGRHFTLATVRLLLAAKYILTHNNIRLEISEVIAEDIFFDHNLWTKERKYKKWSMCSSLNRIHFIFILLAGMPQALSLLIFNICSICTIKEIEQNHWFALKIVTIFIIAIRIIEEATLFAKYIVTYVYVYHRKMYDYQERHFFNQMWLSPFWSIARSVAYRTRFSYGNTMNGRGCLHNYKLQCTLDTKQFLRLRFWRSPPSLLDSLWAFTSSYFCAYTCT